MAKGDGRSSQRVPGGMNSVMRASVIAGLAWMLLEVSEGFLR
jgi:hypothetical protein